MKENIEKGNDFFEIANSVAGLVTEKDKAYGSSFDNTKEFLKLLYPNGIPVESYTSALVLVRIFDKMMRIATDQDAFGEDPFRDICGYTLLALRK